MISSSSAMDYDLDHHQDGMTNNSNQNHTRTSWDHHYQRRGRTQERFDFPSSDAFDSTSHVLDHHSVQLPVHRTGSDISSRSQQQPQKQIPMNHPVQQQQHQQQQRRSRPRPRSADSRPQYNMSPSVGGTSATSIATSRDRAACLNNMFYPGELSTSAGTGTVPTSRSSYSQGQNTVRYYASELPRYDPVVHDDTAYARIQKQRNQQTTSGRPVQLQQPQQMETAVFMLPGNPYESTIGTDPNCIDHQSPYSTASTQIPYPKHIANGTNHKHLYENKDRRYYDYVKENLIMFGDGYGRAGGGGGNGGDAPSVSTGLSQEELLHRKRREETWQKRKEKRQLPRKVGKTTNKIVNLPTSLFMPHTSRQLQEQQQDQQKQQRQSQGSTMMYRDVKSEDGNQMEDDDERAIDHLQPLAKTDEEFHPSFLNSGIGMKDYVGQTSPVTSFSSNKNIPDESKTRYRDGGAGGGTTTTSSDRKRGGEQNGDDEESANSSLNSSNNNKGNMGIRGSMVRRQRNSNQSSSAGRRWKILPSLYRGSNSNSNKSDVVVSTTRKAAKGDSRKADPPARKESSGSWHAKSLDPIPSTEAVKGSTKGEDSIVPKGRASGSKVSFGVSSSGESKSNAFGDNDVSFQNTDDSSRLLFATLPDDFDRFMDEPDLISPKTTRSVSFESRRSNNIDYLSAEEYLTVARVGERTPTSNGIRRPTYADFTPKSNYPRKLFPSISGNIHVEERSPTSAMDFPPGGVRWCETLTQQEFVTPQSAKLDPSSDHRVRRDPLMEHPKSILRKRTAPPAVTSPLQQTNQFDVRSCGELDDSCPSDESPAKTSRSDRGVRVYPDSTKGGTLISDPKNVFIDDTGRSLSPIFGASGSQSTEQDLAEVTGAEELDRIPQWNEGYSSTFERNIPAEFQEAFLSENQISKRNDDSGLLSDSYVNFIEAVASVVIQTKVRQFLASIRVLRLRERAETLGRRPVDIMENAIKAAVVNSKAKTTPLVSKSQIPARKARSVNTAQVASRRDDAAHDFFELAAIQIQAAFRGWWVRDCLSVDSYCASMIQKTYRQYACRRHFAEELNRIVIVQSVWRRFVAIDIAITRMYCIVQLQSIARGFLARRRYPPGKIIDRDVYELAATKVQAQWRSFECEMRFLRIYEDILVVQSLVRGWITRRLLRSWLKAHKMSASGRLQGQTRVATISMQHTNVNQPREDVIGTPPPKKPSKRSDISPSYVHHIEYMRKTLGPEVLEETSSGEEMKSKTQNVVGRLFQVSADQGMRDSILSNRNFKASFKADTKVSNGDTFKSKAECAELKPSKDESDAPLGGSCSARSEIEQRRKRKELEAKLKEEEEQRRKNAHAAELAELESRRQRMSLKAEARQKELAAMKAETNDGSEISNRIEALCNDEEKKESDSVVTQVRSVVAYPPEESMNYPNKHLEDTLTQGVRTKHQIPFTSSRAATFGKTSNFEPTAGIKQTNRGKLVQSRSDEFVPVGRQEMPQTQTAKKVSDLQAEKSTSLPRKGGLVADRMRQILMSSGSGMSNDAEDVKAGTPAMKKERVSESQQQHVSPPLENSNIGASISTSMPPPALSNEDALKSPEVPSSESTGVKRIALTSTTYGDEMRSLRSEAEHKRIEAMLVIFEKAGLMSRVKKATVSCGN